MYPSAPSFFATALTGIFIGGIALYLYVKGFRSMTTVQIATLATLLGILIGIHGILHLGLEWKYDYNPLRNLSD